MLTLVRILQGARVNPDQEKAEGAIAVVDLVGYRKNAEGGKGDPLPDLAIGENVEVRQYS